MWHYLIRCEIIGPPLTSDNLRTIRQELHALCPGCMWTKPAQTTKGVKRFWTGRLAGHLERAGLCGRATLETSMNVGVKENPPSPRSPACPLTAILPFDKSQLEVQRH